MIGTYEERTFNMGAIMVSDSYMPKIKQSQKREKHDYIDESIIEACKCFIKSDKGKRHSKTNSRYFYNMFVIEKLYEKLAELNLKDKIGYRLIKDGDFVYYEVNFKDVLNRTIAKKY